MPRVRAITDRRCYSSGGFIKCHLLPVILSESIFDFVNRFLVSDTKLRIFVVLVYVNNGVEKIFF